MRSSFVRVISLLLPCNAQALLQQPSCLRQRAQQEGEIILWVNKTFFFQLFSTSNELKWESEVAVKYKLCWRIPPSSAGCVSVCETEGLQIIFPCHSVFSDKHF